MSRWTRRTHRADGNQSDLVDEWRKAVPGNSAVITNQVGGDFVDLVLGTQGVTLLAEVKQPGQPLKKGQGEFRDTWQGGPVVTLATVDEIRALAANPIAVGVRAAIDDCVLDIASLAGVTDAQLSRLLATREIVEALAAHLLRVDVR